MNIVLDLAVEINNKAKTSKTLGTPPQCILSCYDTMLELVISPSLAGRVLLKGDNITLIQAVTPVPATA